MTGREFNQAGLHKLSPDELAALNRWIRERSVAQYEAPQGPSVSGQAAGGDASAGPPPIEQMAREPIHSHIIGEFGGWSGDTEFELANGMVWKQDEADRFRLRPVQNPAVTVSPGVFGSWRLSVEGHKRSIRVERIR